MNSPPWEWPADTTDLLLATLRDEQASTEDKRTAADLAGELPETTEELVEQLVATLTSNRETEEVRGTAAIALGPTLDSCDIEGFEDALSEPPINQPAFRKLQASLRALYQDQAVPKLVRRRILEASVRAPEDWHAGAIRAAYASGDEEWKLTAVFCMGYVRGFDQSILEALGSSNMLLQSHAIEAAGNWEIEAAWPQVDALLKSRATPKPLLLAAIQAVASLRPDDAPDIHAHLERSSDQEIAGAVEEALAMADDDD